MKITQQVPSRKFSEAHDYRGVYKILINGNLEADFLDGEPEDANIGRDFSDVHRIPDLMRMAHEAGTRGEELTIEVVEIDDYV